MYRNNSDEQQLMAINDLTNYTHMTKKQYFCVNIAKFLIEIFGTAMLGIFYMMMGD